MPQRYQLPARKRNLLAKRERTLTGAISRSSEVAKLERAAQAVRDSQIQLLKSRLYHSDASAASHESQDIERIRLNIQSGIEKWSSMAVADILAKYAAEH